MGFSRKTHSLSTGDGQDGIRPAAATGETLVTGTAAVYSNVPSHVIPAMRAASGYRLANNDA